jgi:hypothetical protein
VREALPGLCARAEAAVADFEAGRG